MNLNRCFATNNLCYKNAKKMTPKGIMVHSTGANNPNLKRYVQPDDGTLGVNNNGNHFNTEKPGGRKVCVHAFIGKRKDGSVATYQIMPWNWIAWHSGTGKNGAAYNQGYIGFEICEDDLTDKTYFDKVYKEAVELCAHLCKTYNIPVDKVICHSEGHKLGIASNHGDVMHWFPRYGKSMDTLRADVTKMLFSGSGVIEVKEEDDMVYYKTINDVSESYRPTIQKLIDKGALKGVGNGVLNISEDYCRIMTTLDRLGKLD